MLNNIKSPHPLSHKIACETNETKETKQKWPPDSSEGHFLHLTSYIIHRSRFAQASVDELQLRSGESAVLIPAHAFEQGPKRFELAVAVAQVVEQKLLALAQTYRMSAASVRIIGSCQI